MVEVQGRYVIFRPPRGARYLVGDFTDWLHRPLPIEKALRLEMPEGAYLEYAFLDEVRKPFADPDNPHLAQNPWWSYPRAVELPGFRFEAPPAPQGPELPVERYRIESTIFRAARRYYVWQTPDPEVTLYVQDGVAYYRTAHMHLVAQALWEARQIVPLRLVFLEPERREEEYWFSEAYEAFLLEEILPRIAADYGATPRQGLWGASLGGLVSAWLAFRHPEQFSFVGLQSACFTAEPSGHDSYRGPEWLTARYAERERLPLRVYQETGQIEWLLAPNRRFAAVLADKGYPHAYRERPSGHNWVTWKQGLAPGLRFLFGHAPQEGVDGLGAPEGQADHGT